VIGFGVNFTGNSTFGGFGLTGLSGASSSFAAGNALSSADGSRASLAQIKAALTSLRDAFVTARDNADAVPGRTTLQAVTTEITRYVDKPTYVTVNGKPVQNGTQTVADGTLKFVSAYERVTRGRTDIGDALKVLLNATIDVGSAPGLANVNTFGSQIGAFLKNTDVKTALTRPDKAALDSALAQVNGLLARAEGLGFAVNHSAKAAAQVNLGGLLLSADASTLTDSGSSTGTTDTTSASATSAYQTTSASTTTSTSSGGTVSTVA
jgi:hypothetical protein